MERLFLGLDSSTQGLSAIVIDLDSRRVVYEFGLNFSADLPAYGTEYGVLPNDDAKIVHAPPLMWAEALDAVFARMQSDGVALDQILAVSGSGQQHGSVYLNASAEPAIAALDGLVPCAESGIRTTLRSVSPRDSW